MLGAKFVDLVRGEPTCLSGGVVEDVSDLVQAEPESSATAPTGARSTVVRAEVEIPNPYRGLRAFAEADAGAFHGRTGLVDELVTAVNASRFVTVVGASGSGKSSAVRAGLLPRLRRGGVDGSGSWFITTMTPGSHPFEQLEAALFKIAAKAPDNLLEQLHSGDRGLTRVLKQVLPSEESTLLLVLDQFEELFTLANTEQRDQFLTAVATAVGDEASQLRVVATVRADFYDGPLSHPAVSDLVHSASIAVTPMNQVELTEAITLPAQAVGVTIEPALVTRMITDVHGAPGSLPLLQHALNQLFDGRDGSLISEESYIELGGITGALATQAEGLYSDLSPEGQAAARRLFGRLVNLGEGTENTRRRVDQTDLAQDDPTQQVLETYGRARLLSFDRNPQTRTPTVEVTHEALIREWPRLRTWITEDRDELRALSHLATATQAWEQRGRNRDDLYRGNRLEAALSLSTSHADLSPLETEFIRASDEDAESEQQRQVRSNRRLRRSLASAAVLLLLAAVAGVLALRSSREADRNTAAAEAEAKRAEGLADVARADKREAQIDRLISTSRELIVQDRQLAVQLAIEGQRLADDSDSLSTLLTSLTSAPAPLAAHRAPDSVEVRALSADGSTAAFVDDGELVVRAVATGVATSDPLSLDMAEPVIAISRDGSMLAVSDYRARTVTLMRQRGRGPGVGHPDCRRSRRAPVQ